MYNTHLYPTMPVNIPIHAHAHMLHACTCTFYMYAHATHTCMPLCSMPTIETFIVVRASFIEQ